MPYWTAQQERLLIDMVQQGDLSLQEIAERFRRSPEGIRMKIRRLGLEPARRYTAPVQVLTVLIHEALRLSRERRCYTHGSHVWVHRWTMPAHSGSRKWLLNKHESALVHRSLWQLNN